MLAAELTQTYSAEEHGIARSVAAHCETLARVAGL